MIWKETKFGKYTCCHYRTKKWCEDGGVGSRWNPTWTWAADADNKTAREACCICGGEGIKGEKDIQDHIMMYFHKLK